MEGRALRYAAAASIVVAAVVVVVLAFVVPSGSALSVSAIEVAPETPGNVNANCEPGPCAPPTTSPDHYLVSFLVSGSHRGIVRCTVTVTHQDHRLAVKTVSTDTNRGLPAASYYDSVVVEVHGVPIRSNDVSVACR